MPNISTIAVTLRTTSDGGGCPHGLVAGTGPTPDAAMITLKRHASDLASRLTADADEPCDGDRAWLLEVIDVRLTYGRVDGADTWCAYGTLSSQGHSPVTGEADFWSSTS